MIRSTRAARKGAGADAALRGRTRQQVWQAAHWLEEAIPTPLGPRCPVTFPTPVYRIRCNFLATGIYCKSSRRVSTSSVQHSGNSVGHPWYVALATDLNRLYLLVVRSPRRCQHHVRGETRLGGSKALLARNGLGCEVFTSARRSPVGQHKSRRQETSSETTWEWRLSQ